MGGRCLGGGCALAPNPARLPLRPRPAFPVPSCRHNDTKSSPRPPTLPQREHDDRPRSPAQPSPAQKPQAQHTWRRGAHLPLGGACKQCHNTARQGQPPRPWQGSLLPTFCGGRSGSGSHAGQGEGRPRQKPGAGHKAAPPNPTISKGYGCQQLGASLANNSLLYARCETRYLKPEFPARGAGERGTQRSPSLGTRLRQVFVCATKTPGANCRLAFPPGEPGLAPAGAANSAQRQLNSGEDAQAAAPQAQRGNNAVRAARASQQGHHKSCRDPALLRDGVQPRPASLSPPLPCRPLAAHRDRVPRPPALPRTDRRPRPAAALFAQAKHAA